MTGVGCVVLLCQCAACGLTVGKLSCSLGALWFTVCNMASSAQAGQSTGAPWCTLQEHFDARLLQKKRCAQSEASGLPHKAAPMTSTPALCACPSNRRTGSSRRGSAPRHMTTEEQLTPQKKPPCPNKKQLSCDTQHWAETPQTTAHTAITSVSPTCD